MVATGSDALTPQQASEALVASAIALYRLPWASHFIKALMGGFYLSFGGLAALLAAGGSPTLRTENPGLARVLSAAVFPPGLIFVVLSGGILCTASMLNLTISTLTRKTPIWFAPAAWMFQFFGNLAGALLFDVFLVHLSGLVAAEPYASYVQTFAAQKVITPSWGEILCRGLGCNLMVVTAIYFQTASREFISKMFAIYVPIFIFILAGWDHVVANMFYIPLSLMSNPDAPLTTGVYIWKSMIPSFLGNILGAWVLALPLWFMFHTRFGLPTPTTIQDNKKTDLEEGSQDSKERGVGQVQAARQ